MVYYLEPEPFDTQESKQENTTLNIRALLKTIKSGT